MTRIASQAPARVVGGRRRQLRVTGRRAGQCVYRDGCCWMKLAGQAAAGRNEGPGSFILLFLMRSIIWMWRRPMKRVMR